MNKKLHSTIEQKCEEDTQRIDIDDENIAVYPNPCTGHVRIEDNIVVLPKILAIYGIEFDRNKEMKFIPFTAMPRTLNFMGEAWVLTGIVTNDTTHFRALVPIKGTKWVVYDGQDKDKDYKYVDIDGYTGKEVKDLQGRDFGLIAILPTQKVLCYVAFCQNSALLKLKKNPKS